MWLAVYKTLPFRTGHISRAPPRMASLIALGWKLIGSTLMYPDPGDSV